MAKFPSQLEGFGQSRFRGTYHIRTTANIQIIPNIPRQSVEVPLAKDGTKTQTALFFSIKHCLQMLLQNEAFSKGLITTSKYDGTHFAGPETGWAFDTICQEALAEGRVPIMRMYCKSPCL